MREFLIIVSGLILALGFRLSKGRPAKKSGALVFVITMGFAGYCLFGCIGAFVGAVIWFLLPLVDIISKLRKKTYPFEYKFAGRNKPDMTFFPNAVQALESLDELGYEFIERRDWQWLGMNKHHHIFWHPEHKASASICLCEHENVAFAYLSIRSQQLDGKILRTTNFPFSSRLRIPNHICWNHVPCEESRFEKLVESHKKFTQNHRERECQLMLPDPDELGHIWEEELTSQLQFNLETEIITKCGENEYRYTPKGLIYLWWQSVKDIIRLC